MPIASRVSLIYRSREWELKKLFYFLFIIIFQLHITKGIKLKNQYNEN